MGVSVWNEPPAAPVCPLCLHTKGFPSAVNLRPEGDDPEKAHVVADLPRVAAILNRIAPDVDELARPPRGRPGLGAALLGLDEVQAPPSTEARLRAGYEGLRSLLGRVRAAPGNRNAAVR